MPFGLIVLGSRRNKISLPTGVHIFGSERLLGCSDKRIPDIHGQLQVENTKIILKSLQPKPCFYKKCDDDCKKLTEGESVTLVNGDRFGLLLNNYWYEVINIPGNEDLVHSQTCDNTKKDFNAASQNEDSSNNETIVNNDNTDTHTVQQTNSSGTSNGIELQSVLIKNEDLENIPIKEQAALQNEDSSKNETIVNNDNTDTHTVQQTNSSGTSNGIELQSVLVKNEDLENSPIREQGPGSSTLKRLQTPDNQIEIEVKKVKRESDQADTNPATSDQSTSADSSNSADAKCQTPLRERCVYGAACYRKNPLHLSQFSHPRDADWGTAAQGVCPYGHSCRKRDPRHWRDHTHPAGTLPPPPPGNMRADWINVDSILSLAKMAIAKYYEKLELEVKLLEIKFKLNMKENNTSGQTSD